MVQRHPCGLNSKSARNLIGSFMLTARPLGLAVLLCLGTLLSGCVTPSLFESPLELATKLANQAGWSGARLRGGDFTLLTFSSPRAQFTNPQEQTLNIYIEGDGFAWANRFTPSNDPSPRNPTGLTWALKDQGPAIYIARPCQYTLANDATNCSPVFWTSARFAPEVLTSMSAVIDQLKAERKAKHIRLHGYSGGGVVAALLAANRADVVELITYGAPLNTTAWTSLHEISPLRYSLNPADHPEALSQLPQTHYVGENDTNVPPSLLRDFVALLKTDGRAKVVVVKNADHSCCW